MRNAAGCGVVVVGVDSEGSADGDGAAATVMRPGSVVDGAGSRDDVFVFVVVVAAVALERISDVNDDTDDTDDCRLSRFFDVGRLSLDVRLGRLWASLAAVVGSASLSHALSVSDAEL